MATTEEVFSLLCTVRGSEELARVDQSLASLEAKHNALGQAADVASARTVNLGRTMLEGGRIAQDFAQGGIGGILNNIEGLAMALGMGGGVAGLLTAIGVGAVFVAPKLIDLARSFGETKEAVPPLYSEVDNLSEAQKKNAKEVDELRKKGSLYGDDMTKLHELTVKSIVLENQLAEARERAAQVKKMEALREPEVVSEEKARSKLITDRLSGQQASIEAGLVNVATAEEDARLTEEWTAKRKDIAERLKREEPMEKMFGPTFTGMQLREQQEALKIRPSVDDMKVQKQMADLLGGAFAGKVGDWSRIEAVMTAHPEAFSSAARRAFADTSPGAIAQARAMEYSAKVDDQMEKEVKTFRDKERKDKSVNDRLDRERYDSFAATEKLMDQQDEQERRRLEKEAEKKWNRDQKMQHAIGMQGFGEKPEDLVSYYNLAEGPGAPPQGGSSDIIVQLKEMNDSLKDIKDSTEKTADKKDSGNGVILRGASQR